MKKKPRSKDDTPANNDAESPKPVCWDRDSNAQALRVELNDGSVFIFPYAHLSFALLARTGGCETLKLVFSTHEVLAAGHRLRELSSAVQKLSVDWIKAIPARYAQLADTDSALIETITVTDLAAESQEGSPSSDEE